MDNLTPNTKIITTPDRATDQTLQPIQAILAARFAVRKIGHQFTIRSARQSAQGCLPACPNRTEQTQNRPSAEVSNSNGIRNRTTFPPRFTPQSKQTQTRLAAAFRATLAEGPPAQTPNQYLVAGLRHPNRTNPNPPISRSSQAERPQEPDVFSTSLHPRTEQTQTPLEAAYCATQSEGPLNQNICSSLRHPNRTNPSSTTSRKLLNLNRSHSRTWPFSQLCAARTEQTQNPKPSSKASGETY